MKKVVATIIVEKKSDDVTLLIQGRTTFEQDIIQTFLLFKDKCELKMVLAEATYPKSREQLGYYFAAIVPTCRKGFNDIGYQYNEDQTDIELRKMFLYDEVMTPVGMSKFAGSLSTATMSIVSEFINQCLIFADTELGVYIMPADEWKAKNKRL